MSGTLEQYLALKKQAEELKPGHWLAHIEEEVESKLYSMINAFTSKEQRA